jgi:chemotaxis protein methyltransferase CheR
MAPLDPGQRPAEYAFTDRDFGQIAAMVKRDYGLHLEPAKKSLVYSRLARRLRARGLASFADYCRLLEQERGDERDRMLSALTTNVTQFFREAHHFDLLGREVLPALVARARAGGRVRIWSAGCSSGQEPYSIAATVLEVCPDAARLDLRILATDVDPEVLASARAGLYRADDLAGLLGSRQSRLFDETDCPKRAIRAELRALVSFRLLNLVGDWPMSGQFDVIFCRNVAIYFDKPTQERLWSRFADRLAPGGVLFIGHSERLTGPAADDFVSAGVTSYRLTGKMPDKPRGNTWD